MFYDIAVIQPSTYHRSNLKYDLERDFLKIQDSIDFSNELENGYRRFTDIWFSDDDSVFPFQSVADAEVGENLSQFLAVVLNGYH